MIDAILNCKQQLAWYRRYAGHCEVTSNASEWAWALNRYVWQLGRYLRLTEKKG